MTDFLVLHCLPEFVQIYVHWVSNAILPSHPLPLYFPLAFLGIRVFFSESALCLRWPQYWSFSFNISFSKMMMMIMCVCVLVTKSCLTLCNPMDCRPSGSSVHGILQARILEWELMLITALSWGICPQVGYNDCFCPKIVQLVGIVNMELINHFDKDKEFFGRQIVRIPSFHCRRHGFNPWWEN